MAEKNTPARRGTGFGIPGLGSRVLSSSAMRGAVNRLVDAEGNPTPAFHKAVMSAVAVQRPVVLAVLRRIRRKHPEDSPAQTADRLTKYYLNALAGTGATAGGAAFIPGVGTIASMGVSAAAVIGFLEVTALYAQGIAELHGVASTDDESGQALVMAIILGEDGRKILAEAATSGSGSAMGLAAPVIGLANPGMVNKALNRMSTTIFKRLQKTFFRRMLSSQTKQMLGRLVPFGIGAVIGGWGTRKLGVNVARSAQELFGPMPTWEMVDARPEALDFNPDVAERKELKKLEKKQRKEEKKRAKAWKSVSADDDLSEGVDR